MENRVTEWRGQDAEQAAYLKPLALKPGGFCTQVVQLRHGGMVCGYCPGGCGGRTAAVLGSAAGKDEKQRDGYRQPEVSHVMSLPQSTAAP